MTLARRSSPRASGGRASIALATAALTMLSACATTSQSTQPLDPLEQIAIEASASGVLRDVTVRGGDAVRIGMRFDASTTDGAAVVAALDDLEDRIDDVLGAGRPPTTRLDVRATAGGAELGTASVDGGLGRDAIARALDLLATGSCTQVASLATRAGSDVEVTCDGSLTPTDAAATVGGLVAGWPADPTIGTMRWVIEDGVDRAVTLDDPGPATGAAVGAVLASAPMRDVRLARLLLSGAAAEVTGVIAAPDAAVCAGIADALVAAGATAASVRLGLADGQGIVATGGEGFADDGDDRGCVLER